MGELVPEPRTDPALERRLEAIEDALADIREATTAREKAAAKGDLDEAEEAYARFAESKGLSRDEVLAAIDQLRDSKEEARLRGIVKKIMDEDYPVDDGGGDGGKTGNGGGAAGADAPSGGAKPPPKPKEPKVDEPPDASHWTDRKISELLA